MDLQTDVKDIAFISTMIIRQAMCAAFSAIGVTPAWEISRTIHDFCVSRSLTSRTLANYKKKPLGEGMSPRGSKSREVQHPA